MAPEALRMLARQLRRDPNPDAIEDAACALEAAARALRAMMRASENDQEAREDAYRRSAG